MAKAKKSLTKKQKEQRRKYQRARYARLHGKSAISKEIPHAVATLNAPAKHNGTAAPGNPNELIQAYAKVIKHTEDKMLRGRLMNIFIDLVNQ